MEGYVHIAREHWGLYSLCVGIFLVTFFFIWSKLVCKVIPELLKCFLSYFSVFLIATLMFATQLTNAIFSIGVAFSLLGAICTHFIDVLAHKNIQDGTVRENIALYLCVSMLYSVYLILFSSNELYLSNYSEMPIKLSMFIHNSLILTVIVFVVLVVLLMFQLPKIGRMCSYGIFIYIVTIYIQSNFLNDALKTMDGSIPVWNKGKEYSNLLVLLIIYFILVCLFVLIRKRISRKRLISGCSLKKKSPGCHT